MQLAGTTIHELGHVLAGPGHGHDAEWRNACERLGLRLAKASGHVYRLAYFAPSIRPQIASLIQKLADGNPLFGAGHGGNPALWGGLPIKIRPCSLGIGTRGGKSRGKGSGSRLRLYVCQCQPKPIKVRVASDEFKALCLACSRQFQKVV